MDNLDQIHSFIGYLIIRPNDKTFAEVPAGSDRFAYKHKLPLADNIIVANYNDGRFFYDLYTEHNIDFYNEIHELPALIIFSTDNSRDVEILYGIDILDKYPIFDSGEIGEYYFKVPDGETTVQKILVYSKDQADRMQSLGLRQRN